MASTDLLLHPVRLRIVQAFLGDRSLTTSQLAAELGDVPAGSVYRHVALLANAGVLQVISERQVRGIRERTYSIRLAAAHIGAEEAAAMTPADHSQAFMAFAAGLLADFDRYLVAGQPDFVRDGVGYNLNAMWLTDQEFLEFTRDLAAVLLPRIANTASAGRRRRLMATVVLPAPESPRIDVMSTEN